MLASIQNFFRTYLHLDIRRATPGKGEEVSRYAYQQKDIQFPIQPGDKVLDIGSGQNPFPLATHLADYYEGETTHRTHTKLVRDDRPFTNCSIEALPFPDQSFDFIYASHVLEHVTNPQQACEELMRVGKQGYIETPTKMDDILMNAMHLPDHHRWHITFINNTLIFVEYTDQEKATDIGTAYFFNEFHSNYANPVQQLIHEHRPLFFNMFLWKGRFDYYVFDKTGQLIQQSKLPA